MQERLAFAAFDLKPPGRADQHVFRAVYANDGYLEFLYALAQFRVHELLFTARDMNRVVEDGFEAAHVQEFPGIDRTLPGQVLPLSGSAGPPHILGIGDMDSVAATARLEVDHHALNEDRSLTHIRDEAARRELSSFTPVYDQLGGSLASVASPKDLEIDRPDRQRAYAGQGRDRLGVSR